MGDLVCANGRTCIIHVPVLGKLGKLASPVNKNFRKPKMTVFAALYEIRMLLKNIYLSSFVYKSTNALPSS